MNIRVSSVTTQNNSRSVLKFWVYNGLFLFWVGKIQGSSIVLKYHMKLLPLSLGWRRVWAWATVQILWAPSPTQSFAFIMSDFVNIESGVCILISIMSGINGNVCCIPENFQGNKYPISNIFLPIWGRLSLHRESFHAPQEREASHSVPDVKKKFIFLQWVPYQGAVCSSLITMFPLFAEQRKQIKQVVALLRFSIFTAYVVSVDFSPWFTPLWGFQSTKEGSLGSQNWPQLFVQCCWGIW